MILPMQYNSNVSKCRKKKIARKEITAFVKGLY